MNIFNKLVQTKRRKMLIFTLLLLGLVYLNGKAEGISLTYILKKQDNKVQPSCIVEEGERYAAVGWVYPMPTSENQIPNITTKYIPSIKSDFNCKFSKNDICNSRWSIKNWKIDESSERTTRFIWDSRWEDLPTIFISEKTEEFKERVEIQNGLNLGFSVRASDYVELFICNGWNPYNYPCYYIHINNSDIYLQKYTTLSNNTSSLFALERYKAYSNILPQNEWQNFIVSLDNGTLKLTDVNVKRTVIEYHDKEPLQPLYFLMRSQKASLWKIHQNHFMYTESDQVSRLGPQLTINSKDLCVSLYVSTCKDCEMLFFHQNGTTRKNLKYIIPTKENWINVKLKEENVQIDKINIFVETKLKNSSQKVDGFWGIDDVRLCHENEVKVTYLKVNKYEKGDNISCQLITTPNWRPKKLEFDEIKDFPEIEAATNATAIHLTWKQEDPQNRINYFVSYQANDICLSEPFNKKRTKSHGFLMTKYNEIIINNLVPFTHYNITVSTVLHEKDKILFYNTLESDTPTVDELPVQVQIQSIDTMVHVSWDKIDCTKTYGHLVHSLIVSNSNWNFTKEKIGQTENDFEIDGLRPFTRYNLKIITARSVENIESGKNTISSSFDFFTQAGVAPTVENLELYSIDANFASLRYDLPRNPQGVPSAVQVNKCNALSFKKCKAVISKIERCKLWPNKYCVDVPYLIPYQQYIFKVSLKNDNTPSFGKDTNINGYSMEQVPGVPTNLTYKIVDCQEATDYCHLNISWVHPYKQNGTITAFNIMLNSSKSQNGTEEAENIHEMYKVENRTYSPRYTHQIKYVPYSTHYNLFIQSMNTKYKSVLATLHIKTSEIGEHIDQTPTMLARGDSSVLFKLPHLDRRLNFYKVLVIVQDYNTSKTVEKDLLNNKKVSDNICHNYGETWIAQNLTVTNNETRKITIDKSPINKEKKLHPDTKYCLIFVVTNSYKNSEHEVVYFERFTTAPIQETPAGADNTSSSSSTVYILSSLFAILILVSVVGYLYYRKKQRTPKPAETNENVYESLPFEECDDNFANNRTYDQLLHK